jgi:multidrug efflux pump subunit AcrB
VALETAVKRVEEEVIGELRRSGEIPAGMTLDISGASDQLDATRNALSGNFLISLLLCYLLLVAIFTHWGYPLVIMMTVPLGIAGGIVGLWVLNGIGTALPWFGLSGFPHQPFDMITMLGFLILLGTVVNNPILIVDEMRHRLSERGVDPRIAVRAAVDSRLRPVLMSTITTLFGLAPLVFLPGAGTELYRGLGAIVLFGLFFAMLVTLVFLPPLLVTLLELRPLLRRFTGALVWWRGKGSPSPRDPLLGDVSPAERAGAGGGHPRRGGQP